MQRRLRAAGGVLAVLAVAALIAACGGSSGSGPPAARLLSQTFGTNAGQIRSGELSLSVHASLPGLTALGGSSLGVQLSGPFSVSRGQPPAFDLNATVSALGSSIPVGVISAGGALYVAFAGTDYSLPSSIGGLLQREASSQGTRSRSLLTSLGIDPRNWLEDAQDVGSANVGGVSTDHITAQVNTAKFVADLQKILGGLGSAVPGASASVSVGDLRLLARIVKSATVDVYTGASDHIVREFRLAVALSVPQADQAALGGLTGGSLTLDLAITNLNAPETIKPPASSKPFSSLLGGGSLPSL